MSQKYVINIEVLHSPLSPWLSINYENRFYLAARPVVYIVFPYRFCVFVSFSFRFSAFVFIFLQS